MDASKVLGIVLREMNSYGTGWRMDWSDFDGRTLKGQLNSLGDWALKACMSEEDINYTDGTEFLKDKEVINTED